MYVFMYVCLYDIDPQQGGGAAGDESGAHVLPAISHEPT